MDLLKELRSYGDFKLRRSGFPQKLSKCKNVLRVLYHYAKFGGAPISPAAGAAKNFEFFVGLSVRHAFERRRFCVRFRHEGMKAQKHFDAVA